MARSPESRHNGRPLAIAVTDLTKVFQRTHGEPVRAVDHLRLSVPPGQVVAFLRLSRAGKTTTIKTLEDAAQLPT
jgi:ABC-type multidrug transport system ATPase subunit